jgi:hypothetical protein
MEIIGAAALIAVGIVAAAVTYGRMRHSVPAAREDSGGGPEFDRDRAERSAEVARREDAVARREADLERERAQLAARS